MRREADLVPPVFFELCMIFPDAVQLQRILSRNWVREWEGFRSAHKQLELCKTSDMRKWTSQNSVVDFSNNSLGRMVITFPSDSERRFVFMREGISFGEDDGHDFNCLDYSPSQL